MKIVDFDKLSVLNLHYCQYTLDYFLDCMQELGIKNVELLGGHQGLLAGFQRNIRNPEPVRKKLQEHGLKVSGIYTTELPVWLPIWCKRTRTERKNIWIFCKWDTSGGLRWGAEKIEANSGWGYWG